MYQEGYNRTLPDYYSSLELERGKHKNTLRVFGQGQVSAKPDMAEISVGIMTENSALEAAQKENNEISQRVLEGIKNMGIEPKDIRTQNYNIRIRYDYVDGNKIFKGYEVENFIRVILRDINLTGKLIDNSVANGANNIGNIKFRISDSEMYYNEALRRAVEDSQNKAITIANKLKVRINKVPIRIVEQGRSSSVPLEAYSLKASGHDTTIESGENNVIAYIEGVFVYSE